MILCITPNPAIDRTLLVPRLSLGEVHRAQNVIVAAGGKGLNVARTIKVLGAEPLCMGFAGGHTGRLLADLARNEGLNGSWTWVNSDTRSCTILVSQSGDATVINEPGMPVTSADWKRLKEDVQQHLSVVDLVCISGSLPPNASTEDLRGLLSMLVEAGKQTWVDTSAAALTTALTYPDLCIKVNGNEIGEALGIEITDKASAQRALTILAESRRAASAITLGSDGALLATPDERWLAKGPPIGVISTVGSGDAFLGWLVSARDQGKNWPEALCDAVAAGTANALSAGGGQFAWQDFEAIQKQILLEVW